MEAKHWLGQASQHKQQIQLFLCSCMPTFYILSHLAGSSGRLLYIHIPRSNTSVRIVRTPPFHGVVELAAFMNSVPV